MPETESKTDHRLVLCVGVLLLLLGCLLAIWGIHHAATVAKPSALRLGYLFASAFGAGLCGALLLARVMDAALAAAVLLDAALFVIPLVVAAHARVKLSLLVPLLFFGAALVGVAVTATWCRPNRLLGMGVQILYLIVQAVFLARLGRGGGLAWGGLLTTGALAVLCQLAWSEGAGARPWSRLCHLPRWSQALIIYVVGLVGFTIAAGPRLKRPTANNHFVYLADSLLHGRLKLSKAQIKRGPRRNQNDWARVERLTLRRDVRVRGRVLKAGTALRGGWLLDRRRRRSDRFRTTRGQVIRLRRGEYRATGADWYVSFPPMPAVLMVPGVKIWGYRFNDVWFGVLLASLSPMLLFLLLGRLREEGLSQRSRADDLWLTLLFAFGTVNYFVSVRGEVWYTAHVVGVLFLLLFLHAALGVRRPFWSGLFLGCAMASRVALLLAVPLFLAELWRRYRGKKGADGLPLRPTNWRGMLRPLCLFGVPVSAVGLLLLWHNAARFDTPFDFGYRYLDILWKHRIQQWGLFDVHYLSRNLSAAFTFLPHLQPEVPYVLISRHGLSLLFVTPVLLLLLWPRHRGGWHLPLWLSVAAMAGLVLFYQNTGFVQFSYRFALDFMPLLILLLAIGGRPLSPAVKVLIIWCVLINLLGAITFGVSPEFYGRTNWVWTPLDPYCAC